MSSTVLAAVGRAWSGPGSVGCDPEIADTTDILLRFLMIVDIASASFGFGTPYEGQDIRDSSHQLSEVSGCLGAAFPNEGWTGVAAQAYADLNAGYQGDVQTFQDRDRALVFLIKSQAGFATVGRMVCAALTVLLTAAYAYQVYAEKVTAPALAVTSPYEATRCIKEAADYAMLMVVLGWVCLIALQVAALAASCAYGQLLAERVPNYPYLQYSPAAGSAAARVEEPAAGSTVDGFAALAAGMSAVSASPEGVGLTSRNAVTSRGVGPGAPAWAGPPRGLAAGVVQLFGPVSRLSGGSSPATGRPVSIAPSARHSHDEAAPERTLAGAGPVNVTQVPTAESRAVAERGVPAG